jgi:predicted metal-dependent phosphoesterase TrpH
MVNRGYVRSTHEAFAGYLKKGAPAYIPKSILSPERAITTIHKAGGLAVLAHPISLEFETPAHLDKLVAEWADQGLDGIECYYSMHSQELTRLSLSLCKKYDLVPTGGSDYHGKAKPKIKVGIGKGGLRVPYSCVEALMERWNKGGR